MDFTLSNHPTLPAITRTATLKNMDAAIDEKKVVLKLKINHFLEGVHIPELVKDIITTADNTEQVPTGEPAPEPYVIQVEDPENPGQIIDQTVTPEAPTMGEFDYWLMSCDASAPLNAMLAGGIANMDAKGVINRKCNYTV